MVRFRDVGADVVRIEPDGTATLMIIGQVPFDFTGVLKIDLETGRCDPRAAAQHGGGPRAGLCDADGLTPTPVRGSSTEPRNGDMLGPMLEFGVTVLPDPPYQRLIELTKMAEEQGFQYGWTYDSHVLWQESMPVMALLADQTSTIKLGDMVTNPAIRDPTVLASAYATLQDISNGRMIMGVGVATPRCGTWAASR